MRKGVIFNRDIEYIIYFFIHQHVIKCMGFINFFNFGLPSNIYSVTK